jgi:hypothetical protein
VISSQFSVNGLRDPMMAVISLDKEWIHMYGISITE